jgi:hypothetical protein
LYLRVVAETGHGPGTKLTKDTKVAKGFQDHIFVRSVVLAVFVPGAVARLSDGAAR